LIGNLTIHNCLMYCQSFPPPLLPLALSSEITYISCTSFSHVTLLCHFASECSYNSSPCTHVQPFPTLFWFLSLDVSESLVLPVVIYWASSFFHLLMLCSNLISPFCNLHASVWWYVTFLNIAAVIYFFQAQSMLVLHALEHTHTHRSFFNIQSEQAGVYLIFF